MSGRFFKVIEASKLGGKLLASVLCRSKEGKYVNSSQEYSEYQEIRFPVQM